MHHATITVPTHALWCAENVFGDTSIGHLQRLTPANLAALGTITIMDSYTNLFDALDNERSRVDQFYSFWNRR